MTTRKALLGACLALPLAALAGTAFAAQPQSSRTITVPPGMIMLIVPAATSSPASSTMLDDPMLRLIAEQDAMMHDMMAQMDTAFTQPMFPQMDQMIQAALRGTPMQAGAGDGVIVTSVSGGPGMCSERVVYSYPATGGTPQVTVSRSGNACGAPSNTAPLHVMQRMPASPHMAPVAPSHGPRLWTASDPSHPIQPTPPGS